MRTLTGATPAQRFTGLLLAASLSSSVVLTTVPAQADREPPVIPSDAQVQAARRAAATKATQVAAIQQRLLGATARLEHSARAAARAAEAYNGARYRLGLAQAEAKAAAERAVRAARTLAQHRRQVGRFASATYQGGGEIAQLGPLLTAEGTQELLDSASTARSVAAAMQGSFLRYSATRVVSNAFRLQAEQALARVQAAANEAAAAKHRAQRAHRAQTAAVTSIALERRQLIGQLAALRRTSYQIAEQRQRGLEELARQRAAAAAARKAAELRRRAEQAARAERAREKAAREREEQARRDKESRPNKPSKPSRPDKGKGKGKSKSKGWRWAVGTAIDFAQAQLGEPYVWGAEGPRSWDCSGLTMRAWQRAGIDLPHYSVAQYEQSEAIAEDELRPGDLVFWSDDPDDPGTIFHVGLYIGSGEMIHAPRAGRPVTIDNIYYWETPDFFGRVR